MIIEIKVKTNCRKNLLQADGQGKFRAHLTSLPTKGKANRQLINLLSGQFNACKSQISIIKGVRGKNKIVEISY